jgi:hypothetical protein
MRIRGIPSVVTAKTVKDLIPVKPERIMDSGVFDDALIKHLWSTDEFRAIFSEATEWTNCAMQKEKVKAALPVAARRSWTKCWHASGSLAGWINITI